MPPNTKIITQRGGSVPPTSSGGSIRSIGPQAVFTGDRWEFLVLLLKNLFLTILTLGIYRFWAKTNVRIYLWRNIKLMGDRLDYTGTGGELFKGFMFAMVFLFILGMVSTAFDLMAMSSPVFSIIGNLIYLGALTCLIHVAVYRATRYRLTRTKWRGIRMNMDGSQKSYLKKGLIWSFTVLATLGFAYPWAQTALLKYRVDNTRFGRAYFKMKANVRDLLPWWYGIYAMLILSGILVWIGVEVASSPAAITAVIAVGAMIFLGLLVLNAGYRANALNVYVNGLSIDGHRLKTLLPVWGTIWRMGACQVVMFGGIGLVIAMSGLLGLFYADVTDIGAQQDAIASGFIISMVAFFVGTMIGGLLYQVVMIPYVMRHVCQSFAISDPEALERLIQGTLDDLTHGEGLMDGLDADGFDAIG